MENRKNENDPYSNLNQSILVAIGNNDRVHGWNPNYREDPNPNDERFHSFEWEINKPGKFHNLPLPNVADPVVTDHQGHIVPQNLLNTVLEPIANAAFANRANIHSLQDLNGYLTANYPNLNFGAVTHYIETKLMAQGGANEGRFLFEEGDNPEDFVGGYFSVITWNPVNLCRAPSDKPYRGGEPGNNVDTQVRDYIVAHAGDAGIQCLPGMLAAFQAIHGDPAGWLPGFITACNTSLANQEAAPSGYYRFSWHWQQQGVLLMPGPAAQRRSFFSFFRRKRK